MSVFWQLYNAVRLYYFYTYPKYFEPEYYPCICKQNGALPVIPWGVLQTLLGQPGHGKCQYTYITTCTIVYHHALVSIQRISYIDVVKSHKIHKGYLGEVR